MTMAGSDVAKLIAAEAEAAEENLDQPLPDHVTVTRGGRARTLQVRLSDDEYAAIETVAAGRELPVSTVAREILLRSLQQSTEPPAVVLDRIAALLESLRSSALVTAAGLP